jgi:putative heme-binding domain-containing protein
MPTDLSVFLKLAFFAWIVSASARAGRAQTTAVTEPQPRPIAVWPTGPLDVVVAFAQPVDSDVARRLIGQKITYSVDASPAGQGRAAQPAGSIRIAGAHLADDRRTLVLATDPHPRVARYQLPLLAESKTITAPPRDLEARSYDLSGVEMAWSPNDAAGDEGRVTAWWPTIDFESTKRLTRGSKRHEGFEALLAKPGRVVLSTLVRLRKGAGALRIETSGMIEDAVLGDNQGEPAVQAAPGGFYELDLPSSSKGEPLFLSFTVHTGNSGRPFALTVSYQPAPERAIQPVTREQLLVPWAPVPSAAASQAPLVVPSLAGGDPVRGGKLFASDQAHCSQCHAFRGQGGKAGPDLTEIGRKGRADVYRSIAVPSAAIEPEYMTYTIATKDGKVVAGVVRAEDAGTIRVTDTNAQVVLVPRTQIQEIRPSATSIMPPGLAAALGDAAMRDLIAFLSSGQEQ